MDRYADTHLPALRRGSAHQRLNDPFYSTEFKTKGNFTLTWTRGPVSITVYLEHYGRSPNYISQRCRKATASPGPVRSVLGRSWT